MDFLSEAKIECLERDKVTYKESVAKNIENYIGLAKVPVGLAGPLNINGEHAKGTFHVPLATTEGTMVASTCRGMKVLNDSGGVITKITRIGGIQRAPVFRFSDVNQAMEFSNQLNSNWNWLIPIVESSTRHGKLTDIRCFVIGRYVHVRFTMQTGDAAGQNIVTIATGNGVKALIEKFPQIQKFWMEGGFSGEKVPSNLNILNGRGRSVVASASIPYDILMKHTRAKAEDLVQFIKIYSNSSLLTGTKNSHCSLINILSAMFIATGQDIASVPESCMAQNVLDYDEHKKILKWDVLCSNIVAGTVGGGTHLPTQKECLELMDCFGTGKVDKFVEICAAVALANEISLLAAVCADEWVSAHAGLKLRS